MKLWLVQRHDSDNLDVLNGALVRATTEPEARRMVAFEHGDEGLDVWFKASTRCEAVTPEGNAGVLLRDFKNG